MANIVKPPAPGVLSIRQDLADEVADLTRRSVASNTERARKSDWKIWERWCRAHNAVPLPADIQTAAAFIADMARSRSLASVLRYCATIGKAHKIANLTSPFADDKVRAVIEGLKRREGTAPKHAKAAFVAADAMRALNRMAHDHVKSVRDRGVILVGLHTAMRRSEICAIQIEDLTWRDEGIVAKIRKSKTDQHGEGRYVAIPRLDDSPEMCPVRAISKWLRFVKEETGPLFRGLHRGGHPKRSALSAGEVAKIVKRGAASAGLDPAQFGGHSLRSGYVTQARLAGQAWAEIMEQTGHRKLETVKRYDRSAPDPFRSSHVADVFKTAFGRRSQDAESVESLAAALAEAGITITRVGLPPPSLDDRVLSQFQGPVPHQRLCSSGAKWLRSVGYAWSADPKDLRCPGGIADVASESGGIFVETGDTEVKKVVSCLRSGKRVLLIPYGFDGVVGFLLSGSMKPEMSENVSAVLSNAFQKGVTK